MTKKVLYIVFLTLTSLQLFAQGQNNNWFWSFGKRITFNTNPPSVIPTASPIFSFFTATATVSSPTGVLLFYTDGKVIKDASHNTMPNGTIIGSPNIPPLYNIQKQGALIVPDPGNSNCYYLFLNIFYGSTVNLNSEFLYCKVDMTLNGGMGDVISTSKNIFIANDVASSLTAIKQTGTNNFWIITHSNSTNTFNAFLLTASGISSMPVSSVIGPNPSWLNTYANTYICTKANPQGNKVARVCQLYYNTVNSLIDTTELYDFNSSTGAFTNFQLLSTGHSINASSIAFNPMIEFSMNGNLLYRGLDFSSISLHDTIVQFDLLNNNSVSNIPIKRVFYNPVGITDLQLAPNGKIYVSNDSFNASNNTYYMGVIDQPNVPGLGCNYVIGAQPIGYSSSTTSNCVHCPFPNIVPSFLLLNSFSPTVVTQFSNNVLSTTATLHADVSSDGNSPITQRGFYYATTPLPLTNMTIVPGTTGPYFANLTGLTPNTLYYYRAFATNANGTTILYDSTFHTLPLPNTAPLIKNVHNKVTCVSDTMCFVVVDAQTTPANTTLTFTSSNSSLLPLTNMFITGADTNKVLSFTPTPYQSGTSLVTITAIDSNGASSSQNFLVIVSAGLPITISAVNGTSACSGDSVLLQCAIPQGTTINWYVNAIASGIGSAQYATTQSASIYAVCTNAQGCATISNTINAIIKPLPQVQCTINGPATICVGDSVQLQALSTAGYSYQWFKNTQLLPNANSAIYYAKQSGDYSYVATLNGCSKTSNTQTVQVVPAPIASITTPNTTVICNGQGALLQATTGTGYTYQWTMNGFDIAGATNPTYTATIGSYYTVKVSNGYCARTSSPITITVNTAPVAIIHWNGTQLFSPISFYSYQWYLNGVLIPGATSQYYTPTQTGLYYVMVSNENGCKSLSPNYNLLTLSINSLSTPSLPIYPNPTTGMLQVDNFKEGTLYVYNAMGQLIIQQTEPIIDLSKQANGIYHVRAYNQAQELIGIGRVVKE